MWKVRKRFISEFSQFYPFLSTNTLLSQFPSLYNSIWKDESFCLLILQNCLHTFSHYYFIWNSASVYQITERKTFGNVTEAALNYRLFCRTMDFFIILSIHIHEHNISLYLFKILLALQLIYFFSVKVIRSFVHVSLGNFMTFDSIINIIYFLNYIFY